MIYSGSAFIFHKEFDSAYHAISDNQGKIIIKSRNIAIFWPALTKGFFINYQTYKKAGRFILPNEVILTDIINLWTNKYKAFLDLIFFFCKEFILEGKCTKSIYDKLLILIKDDSEILDKKRFLCELLFEIFWNASFDDFYNLWLYKYCQSEVSVEFDKDCFYNDIINVFKFLKKNNDKLMNLLTYIYNNEI
jgi:hypothetical protein